MKWLNKIIRPLIREAVEEEINRIIQIEPPKLKRMKISKSIRGELNIWEMLSSNPKEISFCVRWVDDNGLENFKSYNCSDVAELRYTLKNFKPLHKQFSGVSLHVTPIGSLSPKIESFGEYKKIYDYEQMENLIEPILWWIEAHPELII